MTAFFLRLICVSLLCCNSFCYAARFSINPEGSEVSDSLTGLTWKRCPEGTVFFDNVCNGSALTFDWFGALGYANNAAVADGLSWRLPNAKEIGSILAFMGSGTTTIFPSDSTVTIWLGTPYSADPNYSWYAEPHLGIIFQNPISAMRSVLLVR